jgi:D-3-phosphoglycerate dehydrogenase
MKPDALLINTSRGGVVDETALAAALRDDRIAGAGLDVFSEEPVRADNPLLKLDSVILTPHTAALTRECVTRMATEAAKCVLDVFAGREPRNVANRQILESGRWKHLIPGQKDLKRSKK